MEPSEGHENDVSAVVTTGNTPIANLIPTENEDLATNDGNAEAIERPLREYCIQSKRDLADVNRLMRMLRPVLS
ncbi:hypothetical protein D915_002046 [Fasciola hepatica]|uniref:Uncharacterized protein n=1 Tax=Fasciola hepatica TaxID=6192 RepID=A0A4E0RK66_FASHE|nr:hypothetical protein D915_002046 [Fasciola hepatica]